MSAASSQSTAGDIRSSFSGRTNNLSIYYLLFFLSGFPALLYQIVWERALFTLYGVNIESVTMIVTVFMLGLGLGSLAGGKISSIPKVNPILGFGLIEFSVGVFGSASLWIFHRVGALTAGHSAWTTGAVAFALLLVPTLLMGSTLPLLVEHIVRQTGNVGRSVGSLYCVNTFGSAVACYAAAVVLMRTLGETGTVRLACVFNLVTGLAAIVASFRSHSKHQEAEVSDECAVGLLPFSIGVLLAGVTGFVALGYEIIWYRLYSFASGGRAESFALLLAFYLFGIACGSHAVQDTCKTSRMDPERTLRLTGTVVLFGSLAAFLVGPALSHAVAYVPFRLTYSFVLVAATVLGSAFPLIAHATIRPAAGAGKGLSYLYLGNIIGAALGSFLVGFVILNYWSTWAASTLLFGLGFAIYVALAVLGPIRWKNLAAGAAICLFLSIAARPLYSDLYARLLIQHKYNPAEAQEVVENRSGVINVLPDGTVFGGGIYDGHFNTGLINDTNGLVRAFAVCGLHPDPAEVLVIGLSSGSWAQVIANDPRVKSMTIVEINPGYLPLIEERAEVRSLLRNPKVHIFIDDGRRWLVAHPGAKFDFFVMNTTYNWRANASNLLSRDFLELVRSHLKKGGVAYYNTTLSEEAMATGIAVFPYSLRIWNFLAVSDSPILFDKERWRDRLVSYAIDGKPVFDLSKPLDSKRLAEVLRFAEPSVGPYGLQEPRDSLVKRLKNVRIITDDNMGTEWR